MELTLALDGRDYAVDLAAMVDISTPVRFDDSREGPFGASPAKSEPLRSGKFVGSVALGGSCNCAIHTFCAHTSGTHTECVGHILQQPVHICDVLRHANAALLPATLITVQTQLVASPAGGQDGTFDRVITRHDVSAALATETPVFLQAVIVRTRHGRRNAEDRNPPVAPYFAAHAIRYLVEMGVQHLLTDLPSLDREDNVELSNHRIFWEAGPRGREGNAAANCVRTVTELIHVPDKVKDGPYLLNLQVAAFAADAAPSRPLLYPVRAL